MPEPTDEEFWSAVRTLPRRQAQVVALHYLYDLSVTDVALTLEMSQGTTKTHRHGLGRAWLRLSARGARAVSVEERARAAGQQTVAIFETSTDVVLDYGTLMDRRRSQRRNRTLRHWLLLWWSLRSQSWSRRTR